MSKNFDKILYLNNSIGSDENDGSKNKPYSTMSKIMAVISASTGTSFLVYIEKGIYQITSLISLSCSRKKITFIGKNKNTTLLVNQNSGSFNGSIDICNLIIKPSDNFAGDTRVIVYTTDGCEVNYRNCLFLPSDNGKFPTTSNIMYVASSGIAYVNKNMYNCSIKGLKYICASGCIKIYNCCTDASDILQKSNVIATDCITGVTYKKDYKINNTDYGVYSGNNAWNDIKALLNDNGTLKTYDRETNSLIDFSGSASELLDESSNSTFIEDLDDVRPFLLKKGVKIILNRPAECNIKAIKTIKQLFIANGDFYTNLAEHIDYFKFEYSIPNEDCTVKIIISVDSGQSWYYYNDGWHKLNNTVPLKDFSKLSDEEKNQLNIFLDEVLNKGIDIKETEFLNFNDFKENKIRFGYAIEIKEANSEAIIKNLKLQFDSVGSYIQLNPKTDINIRINNNNITINPLKDMELIKINAL